MFSDTLLLVYFDNSYLCIVQSRWEQDASPRSGERGKVWARLAYATQTATNKI